MLRSFRELPVRAKRQFVRDLRVDPYLRYILVVSVFLTGFWFWHRIPNFATRDERARVLDVLVAYGTVFSDPSIDSFRTGIEWGRPYGATFYLYAIVLFPVVLLTVLFGTSDVVLAFDSPTATFGYWPVWNTVPEWFWMVCLSLVRLTSVVFAVGSVYLTYRIGTLLRDRMSGRLAATMLTITFGFLVVAHEGGEDVPSLFFILLALYLALRYIDTGDEAVYLAGCVVGGIAIAFKFTAAPLVVLLGLAFFLRARHVEDRWATLVRPKTIVAGAGLGAVTIVLGFPSVFVSGFDPLIERITQGMGRSEQSHGPTAPIWWWYLRSYANGLGLPLSIASVLGVLGSVLRLRDRSIETSGVLLLLGGIGSYLVLFSSWQNFRVHHLLPTFPMLAILVGVTVSRLFARSQRLARPILAVLLVTGGAYAVVGDLGYATQPMDDATTWLDRNASENASMEVYRADMHDIAVPHGMTVHHPNARAQNNDDNADARCPEYLQLGYRDLYFLNPETPGRTNPSRAAYIRSLLNGSRNYEIAAEFGRRPDDYAANPSSPGSVRDALWVGLVPRVPQYGDEQDLGPDQFTVVLHRTGPC